MFDAEEIAAEIYSAAGGCAAVPMPLEQLMDRIAGEEGFTYSRAVALDDAALMIEPVGWVIVHHPDASGDVLRVAIARGLVKAWAMLRGLALTRGDVDAVALELLAPAPAIRLARSLGFTERQIGEMFVIVDELAESGVRSARRSGESSSRR
jgi:hypothetical protein